MAGDKSSIWYKTRNTNPADWSGGGQPLDPAGALPLRPPPQAGAVRLRRLTSLPVCSAPPHSGGLATYAKSDFTYVKKGSELRPEPSEPFPNLPNLFRTFRTFSYSSLLSGGPLNGPPRQVVIAGRRHNCRPSRQSGGCAPRPPLMPKGSGFGVRDSRGETQYSEPCGFGMSPLGPIPKSTPLGVLALRAKKNGSLTAPKSGQGKRCQRTVVVLATPFQRC